MTQNQNAVTEEEKKDDARYKEINTKPEVERTADEKKELGELKTRYAGRAEKRIGQLSGEKKAEKARADAAEQRAEEAERKRKEAEEKLASGAETPAVVGNENETEKIGEQKWFTNAALNAQIKSGKITQSAAEDYALKRDEEKITVRVTTNLEKKQSEKALKEARETDAQAVLNAHPEWNVKHPDHNPNDPLYVQWKELVADGYGTNPQGLTKALKKAKQILGIKTPIDRSADLGIEDVVAPEERGGKKGKEKEVTLTETEEDSAVNMYTSVTNPATGRLYTRDEAIAKAKAAKAARRR